MTNVILMRGFSSLALISILGMPLFLNQTATAQTASIAREAAPITRDEVSQLFRQQPDRDNIEEKSKRRTCIDGGGSWVTNSHGSFCWNRHASAVHIRELGFSIGEITPPSPNNSNRRLNSVRPGAGGDIPTWVWLERRRCVRGGGVFWENSSGTFCMNPL